MLAPIIPYRYAQGAAANSAVRFGDRQRCRRTSANRDNGAFFAPTIRVYGSGAWEPFGAAGFLYLRFANPRIAAPIFLARDWGGSTDTGVSPMLFPTRNPSARAAAHRAMARAALFSDSSAAVRLRRFNHHTEKARRLEAAVRGQEVAS